MNIQSITSSTTITANTEARCNTTTAAFTLTFPASPTNNDFIRVIDYTRNFGVNAVTVNVGSKNINGASTMLLSVSGSTYEFSYISASNEWVVFFDTVFNPYTVQAVTPGSNVTASITNNNLSVGLGSGVVTGTITGLSDGQFLVAESSTWVNKSLASTDLTITDAPTTVTLAVNKGNLTETGSSVLQITNGTGSTLKNATIQVNQSNASTNGYLSSTDWSTFNSKLSTITTTTPAITIAGNAINLANQSANTVLAGPTTGVAALPGFRSLVSGDILPAILSGTFTAGMIAVYDTSNFLATSALTWISNKLTVAGTVAVNALQISEVGGAKTMGTATLGTSGRVVVLTSAVTATSRIFLTYQTKTGVSNATLNYQTIVVGTSFTIQSSSTADRSVVAWHLINPA